MAEMAMAQALFTGDSDTVLSCFQVPKSTVRVSACLGNHEEDCGYQAQV